MVRSVVFRGLVTSLKSIIYLFYVITYSYTRLQGYNNSNHLNQGKFMYIIRYNKYTNYFLVPSILSIWLPFLDNKKIDINIMFSSLRISKKMIRMKREDEGEERRLHKLITEMIICVNDASDGIIEY